MEVEMSVYSKENYVRIYMLSAWNRCKKSKRCFVKADSSDNGESLFDGLNVSLCCYLLMRSESVEEESLRLYIHTSTSTDNSSQLI